MPKPERSVPEPVRVPAPDGLLLILSNLPDAELAASVARSLVEEGLAACVNVLGPCSSVYRWRGAIEEADEITVLVKTTRRRHEACRQRLADLHPYEVPEIVTLSPEAVWPAYAAWAIAETRQRFGGGERS
jgi:periplasmic divalent cation tolerance protein